MNCKIDIKGLGPGDHQYAFHIDGAFFESFENDTVSDADVEVRMILTGQPGAMTLAMEIYGAVTVQCDRCLADLALPVDVKQTFAVTFQDSEEDGDECADDEIAATGDGTELNVAQVIYDYICTSLPIRKVHEDGKCDPAMMEKMKDILR